MAMFADVGVGRPVESYQYAGARGYPYAGTPELMNQAEYLRKTTVTCRAGYGNFDTAKVDEEHFGRTLREVLAKSQTGEYRILSQQFQWVKCSEFGVRVLHFIQWVEYSDRPTSQVVRAASTARLQGMPK